MDGWICLHRKIRKNPVFNDMELLRLWLICLTEASHTNRNQMIGRQTVELQAGEFVTGRFDLHEMYNSGLKNDQKKSAVTVWRWLEFLEKSQFLIIKPTTKFSVVSIVNWDLYQDHKPENDQQVINKRSTDDQQVINNVSSNDQQVITNNNYNNYNNVNKKEIKTTRQRMAYVEDSSPFKMAVFFYSKIKEWTDKVQEPNYQLWADECRKILELDKRDKEQVKTIIEWATSHHFWQKNILSPGKLRKQFERLGVEMDSDSKKIIQLHSRGGEKDERSANNGSLPVGSQQNFDLFVRR